MDIESCYSSIVEEQTCEKDRNRRLFKSPLWDVGVLQAINTATRQWLVVKVMEGEGEAMGNQINYRGPSGMRN